MCVLGGGFAQEEGNGNLAPKSRGTGTIGCKTRGKWDSRNIRWKWDRGIFMILDTWVPDLASHFHPPNLLASLRSAYSLFIIPADSYIWLRELIPTYEFEGSFQLSED